MKKLLFIFALMLGVVSCGNTTNNVSEVDSIDSISVDTIDSLVVDSIIAE